MKKFSLIIILALLCACTPAWQSKTTIGYEATGSAIKEVGIAAKAQCDVGTLKPEDCVIIKDIYTKARDAYIIAGDSLIIALTTHDAVTKDKALESYQLAIGQLSALMPKLVQIGSKYGLFGGK